LIDTIIIIKMSCGGYLITTVAERRNSRKKFQQFQRIPAKRGVETLVATGNGQKCSSKKEKKDGVECRDIDKEEKKETEVKRKVDHNRKKV
jgi:hypothetical protein